MEKMLHPADSRGAAEHGWLSSRFSFSFAQWHEPRRMGFGALRVLNDDTIAPASGFPPHSHKDMEIITIVMEGAVSHQDSLGNKERVAAGEVQVMSAGTGVTHAEYNESKDETLKLFQIWIEPKERGIAPRYGQKAFAGAKIELLVSPDGREGSLAINQDAYITRARESLTYALHDLANGVYIFIISGSATMAGEELYARDALGVIGVENVKIAAGNDTDILIIEVPI